MQTDAVEPTQLPSPLEDVKHLKVSDSNLPTSSPEGLDFDRCSALHNAIVKHQWQAGGNDPDTLPATTWWQSPRFAAHLNNLSKHLPDSLVKFLQRTLHPNGNLAADEPAGNMFYLIRGLATPDTLWSELGEDMGDGDRIALYLTDYEISDPSIDGIVYDFSAHCCVFNSYPYNEFVDEDKTPIWQYLETVLTAWINMIERQKAVVVHGPFTNCGPDPVTGVICDGLRHPWGWASYTRADLDETVETWHGLISAINERLPEPHPDPLSNCPGLFEASDLATAGIAEDSFAWQFYRKARRPHFRFLGPGGLQLW